MSRIDLDTLLGTDAPESQIVSAITVAEMRILDKLERDFQLSIYRLEIIRALYRFKKLYHPVMRRFVDVLATRMKDHGVFHSSPHAQY